MRNLYTAPDTDKRMERVAFPCEQGHKLTRVINRANATQEPKMF